MATPNYNDPRAGSNAFSIGQQELLRLKNRISFIEEAFDALDDDPTDSIPTKLSELQNDEGFMTQEEVTELIQSMMRITPKGKNLYGGTPGIYYPVNIAPGEMITVSTPDTPEYDINGVASALLYIYDAQKSEVSYWSCFPYRTPNRTLTVPEGETIRYIKIVDNENLRIQLEKGSSVTTYEDYIP